MNESVDEKAQKKAEAKSILIKRIIPWTVIALFVFFGLVFNDSNQAEAAYISPLWSLLLSYVVFCLPWLWNQIVKDFKISMIENAVNKNRTRFGLDLFDLWIAIRTLISSIKLVLITFIIVPYNVIKTIIVVVRK